jgi:hypothetical protein
MQAKRPLKNQARRQKLAEALRANLKRRKEKERALSSSPPQQPEKTSRRLDP